MYTAILCVAVLWLSYCRMLSVAEAISATDQLVPKLHGPAKWLPSGEIPNSSANGIATSKSPKNATLLNVQVNEISVVDPSSRPSAQPSHISLGEPSSQPTSLPSSQPSSISTSIPTWQPTSSPSLQPTANPSHTENVPTSAPSTQPTSLPSSQPTALPTQLPTQTPTCQPTSAPSRFQVPSGQPTSLPSSKPSEQPSSLPTSQPVSHPTAVPSQQPTSLPTVQPTVQPSSRPSHQPTSHPTARPSAEPSSQPTSSPSAVPSAMPSPAGKMGVTWWYLVTARCDLLAPTPISQHNALDDVIYAFSAGLTDHLDNVERESVELTAVEISSESSAATSSIVDTTNSASTRVNKYNTVWRKLRSFPTIQQHSSRVHSIGSGARRMLRSGIVSMRKHHHKQSDPYKKSYTIETWCADHPTAVKVYEAMELFGVDDTEILEPLHERGLTEVSNITISALSLSTSEVAPPLDPIELSPVRITWIIVGTVVLFFLGVLLVSRAKHYKYFCSQTCLEDTARSGYNALADGCMLCLRSVGLVSSDLRLYYGSGFDLTTQEEEADFYGETRSNLPSDNLDIHYGGDHRSLRAKYLEDDDEAHNTTTSSSSNISNTLNARLPPKHGRIRAGLGKLFGKLRGTATSNDPNGYAPAPASSPHSPHSRRASGVLTPGRISPGSGMSGMIEMSERNGREVVSPITVPTRFTSSPHSSPPFNDAYAYADATYNALTANDNNLRSGSSGNSGSSGHYSRHNNVYDPHEDSIDDLGGFTLAPLQKPSARYKHVPEDDYESFVV